MPASHNNVERRFYIGNCCSLDLFKLANIPFWLWNPIVHSHKLPSHQRNEERKKPYALFILSTSGFFARRFYGWVKCVCVCQKYHFHRNFKSYFFVCLSIARPVDFHFLFFLYNTKPWHQRQPNAGKLTTRNDEKKKYNDNECSQFLSPNMLLLARSHW